LPERFFERFGSLCGAITRRSCTIDLRGTIFVIAHRKFRTGDLLNGCDRVERHHLIVTIAHIKLADVFRVGSVIAFRLDIDLPLASEAVEVVHKKSTHEGLKRLIDLCEIDTLLQHFVAIHLDEDLRHSGLEGGTESGDLRTLARGFQKCFQVLGEEFDVLAGSILQNERKSARSANARNRWRWKGKRDPLADCSKFFVQARFDRLILLLRLLALTPLIQGNKEEAVVSSLNVTKKTEANHARRILDSWRLTKDVLDFLTNFISALERRGIR
jgi:hypothetical protein